MNPTQNVPTSSMCVTLIFYWSNTISVSNIGSVPSFSGPCDQSRQTLQSINVQHWLQGSLSFKHYSSVLFFIFISESNEQLTFYYFFNCTNDPRPPPKKRNFKIAHFLFIALYEWRHVNMSMHWSVYCEVGWEEVMVRSGSCPGMLLLQIQKKYKSPKSKRKERKSWNWK